MLRLCCVHAKPSRGGMTLVGLGVVLNALSSVDGRLFFDGGSSKVGSCWAGRGGWIKPRPVVGMLCHFLIAFSLMNLSTPGCNMLHRFVAYSWGIALACKWLFPSRRAQLEGSLSLPWHHPSIHRKQQLSCLGRCLTWVPANSAILFTLNGIFLE